MGKVRLSMARTIGSAYWSVWKAVRIRILRGAPQDQVELAAVLQCYGRHAHCLVVSHHQQCTPPAQRPGATMVPTKNEKEALPVKCQ